MKIQIMIRKINQTVLKIQKTVTGALLLGMAFVVLSQIVLRYFLSLPTPWAEEIARIIMIWIVFIGSAGMLIRGEHLCVDVIYRHFGIKLKKIIRVIYDVLSLVFIGFVIVFSFKIISNPVIYKSFTPIAHLPLVFYYLSLPISMLLMIVFEIGDIIEGIIELIPNKNLGGNNK